MFVDNLELNPNVRARGGHFVWAWLLLCLTPFQRERAPTKSAKSTPKERRRSSIQVAFKWDSPGVVIIIQHWKMKKAKQNKTKQNEKKHWEMILSYLLLCITLFYDSNCTKKVAILFHVFE